MCPPKYGANFITVSEMFELPRTSNSFTGVGFLVSLLCVALWTQEQCCCLSECKKSLGNVQVSSLLWVPNLSAGLSLFITNNTPFQMSGNYFANNCPIRRVSSMVFYYSIILVSTF